MISIRFEGPETFLMARNAFEEFLPNYCYLDLHEKFVLTRVVLPSDLSVKTEEEKN
jgi:hypothetical protein